MMGSSAIVASTYSHSLGAAYALKHLRSRNIAVSVTGDGSTEEGTFHETLNFASLKKLPVLFVIENNGLSINTPIQERQAFKLPALTRAYGIKYDIIRSGAEIGTSYDKLLKAVHYVRNTSRPLLVEVITCRYKQHVGISDDIDKGFRDLEEYDKWKCGDPLIKHPDLTAKFEKRIRREIKSAVAFARQSPFPSMEELLKDVY